ncbi:TetR/AcrR family transcriptional regulator [Nocardia brasiliensis]
MPITTAAHILRAARHIFYWRGVQMTSVSDITAGTGISPAGLYGRFDSKDDLLLAYAEETCTRYQEWFGIVHFS